MLSFPLARHELEIICWIFRESYFHASFYYSASNFKTFRELLITFWLEINSDNANANLILISSSTYHGVHKHYQLFHYHNYFEKESQWRLCVIFSYNFVISACQFHLITCFRHLSAVIPKWDHLMMSRVEIPSRKIFYTFRWLSVKLETRSVCMQGSRVRLCVGN